MKVWLDDMRPAPAGWWRSKTTDNVKRWLKTGNVTHLSLDHDLGLDPARFQEYQLSDGSNEVDFEITAYELVLWMAEHNIWPSDYIGIHSDNAVGCENMAATIDRYSPFTRIGKSFKFRKETA
jgi:hypothetical protein